MPLGWWQFAATPPTHTLEKGWRCRPWGQEGTWGWVWHQAKDVLCVMSRFSHIMISFRLLMRLFFPIGTISCFKYKLDKQWILVSIRLVDPLLHEKIFNVRSPAPGTQYWSSFTAKTVKLCPKSYRDFVLNLELEIATCYFTLLHFFMCYI